MATHRYTRLDGGSTGGVSSLAVFLALSLAANLALIAYIFFQPSSTGSTLYSPANAILRPVIQKFNPAFGLKGPGAIYTQPPSAAVDAAWRALYYTTLTVPRSDAEQLPNKTIPVSAAPDAGYLVGLSVFHDLHCLDSMRKALWDGVPLAEMHPGPHGADHLLHCVDNLRETLMCHADVAPLSWQWSDEAQGLRVFSDVAHQCRDFDAVLEWGRRHDWQGGLDTTGWPDGRPPEVGRCGVGDEGCGWPSD